MRRYTVERLLIIVQVVHVKTTCSRATIKSELFKFPSRYRVNNNNNNK